jgi:hypothetical protein
MDKRLEEKYGDFGFGKVIPAYDIVVLDSSACYFMRRDLTMAQIEAIRQSAEAPEAGRPRRHPEFTDEERLYYHKRLVQNIEACDSVRTTVGVMRERLRGIQYLQQSAPILAQCEEDMWELLSERLLDPDMLVDARAFRRIIDSGERRGLSPADVDMLVSAAALPGDYSSVALLTDDGGIIKRYLCVREKIHKMYGPDRRLDIWTRTGGTSFHPLDES